MKKMKKKIKGRSKKKAMIKKPDPEANNDEIIDRKNRIARQMAFENALPKGNLIPTTVSYESHGYALFLWEQDSPLGWDAFIYFISELSDDIKKRIVVIFINETQKVTVKLDTFFLPYYFANKISIKGYLGAFDVTLIFAEKGIEEIALAPAVINRKAFDLILDFTQKGVHSAELPPLGYFKLIAENELETAKEALTDFIGIFDKPKFFQLDNDICAHYYSGHDGCSRCIDSCASDAIEVIQNQISINPFLCQGQGSCVAACPTEAIRYDLPDAISTQDYIKQLIDKYYEKGGSGPVILFYASASKQALQKSSLPSQVLAIELEELASVGLDSWFYSLSYGAKQILLFDGALHQKTRKTLDKELADAHSLLQALDLKTERISYFSSIDEPFSDFIQITKSPAFIKGTNIQGTKRERLASALDLLAKQRGRSISAGNLSPITPMSSSSPYGSISINTSDCTLCLSCVAACPTDALKAVETHPGITFYEQACVQCGLCEQSCPESVIELHPGYNWDKEKRQGQVLLHEEAAAKCISCGKAYAPISMINMLIKRLEGHSHYQEDAIKRLSMCEDCRVRDMVQDVMILHPEKQLKL